MNAYLLTRTDGNENRLGYFHSMVIIAETSKRAIDLSHFDYGTGVGYQIADDNDDDEGGFRKGWGWPADITQIKAELIGTNSPGDERYVCRAFNFE